MYSCLHCEIVSSNRNSFNRHLRNHLGTDVTFIKDKIEEEEKKNRLGTNVKDEIKEENEIINGENSDFDQEMGIEEAIEVKSEDITDDLEELKEEITDVTDILKRYEHLDSLDLKSEELLQNVLDDTIHPITKEEKPETKEGIKLEVEMDTTEDDMKPVIDEELKDDISDNIKTKPFQCPECGKGFSLKGGMKMHYKSIHEGIKYPCNLCDFQATQPSNLQTHKKKKHGGVTPKPKKEKIEKLKKMELCKVTEDQVSIKSDDDNVSDNKDTTHQQKVAGNQENSTEISGDEKIKYPCTKCDRQFTEKGNLKKHIRIVHEKFRFRCDKCEYESADIRHVRNHVQRIHAQ